jgi:hypothetical protein
MTKTAILQEALLYNPKYKDSFAQSAIISRWEEFAGLFQEPGAVNRILTFSAWVRKILD